MKVLFVFEDGKQSSFFVYDLKDQHNTLIRVAPEIKLKQLSLGELYQQVPIGKFLAYFSLAFGLDVKKYLILRKKDSLKAIKEAGLAADGRMEVAVAKDFSAHGQTFHAGIQRLDLAELDAYITYQIDPDGKLDVFERQEDIIRLMKRKTVRPKLSTITKNYSTVKEFSGNNLNLKDMLKMGTGYLAKGNARMEKINVPQAGSYQLIGDFPYQLGPIDWQKNTIRLTID